MVGPKHGWSSNQKKLNSWKITTIAAGNLNDTAKDWMGSGDPTAFYVGISTAWVILHYSCLYYANSGV